MKFTFTVKKKNVVVLKKRAKAINTVVWKWIHKRAHIGGAIGVVLILTSAWLWFGMHQPPTFFPVRTIVAIPEGVTLSEAAEILKEEQVIRSVLAFRLAARLTGVNPQVHAGDYYFTDTLALDEVVERVTRGIFGLDPIRITIPEGATTYQMAEIYDDALERFDAVTFTLLSKGKEGYLFPDTYLFRPNTDTSEVLDMMERTFYERLQTLEEKIAVFGRPVHEVVTMASLLEKEARDVTDRRMIAGVLWERLHIGMPLQVDAVFGYIERRETFNPSFSDLEIDSPYNTYKNSGLPPGPIGSPSLDALEAAISPIPTEALFYLHGRDGVLRVAQTYDEHLVNRRRYLD